MLYKKALQFEANNENIINNIDLNFLKSTGI